MSFLSPFFQGRYKFNSQMRNPPANVQPGVMSQAPPQSVVIPGQEPLTATMLAAAPPQEQKQVSEKVSWLDFRKRKKNATTKITDIPELLTKLKQFDH